MTSPAALLPAKPALTDEQMLERYNAKIASKDVLDTCILTLNGRLASFDRAAKRCCMTFQGDSKTMSNGRSLQGGFAAAMLDTCCAWVSDVPVAQRTDAPRAGHDSVHSRGVCHVHVGAKGVSPACLPACLLRVRL
jgi:hypothetical protein